MHPMPNTEFSIVMVTEIVEENAGYTKSQIVQMTSLVIKNFKINIIKLLKHA